MDYRREIDGLRAVAVLPVIFFHAGAGVFSGGFVGVDVFFVISGYLITSILVSEMEAGTFSIARFYERRARRILPALFFVMAACVPAAWLLMTPDLFEDFVQSIVAVIFFSSNFLFWLESGYFSADADLKPLLHTWSLAVEEQFYLIFPVFLLLVWWLGRSVVFWIIIVIAAVSLGLSEWGSRYAQTANFFLAPTRAWELLAGSLCALAICKRPVQSNEFLSSLGMALIVFSIFAYDKSIRFPSLYTVVPVAGTVLVILYAHTGTWVARLLSLRALVGIGLISYSAYLWHQPLFAFARIRDPEDPGLIVMMILAVVSLLLAALTWRFIEQPFRRGDNSLLPNQRAVFGASGVVALGFILTANHMQSVKTHLELENPNLFEAAEIDLPATVECPGFETIAIGQVTCVVLGSGEKTAVVWGDSHAAALLNGAEPVSGYSVYLLANLGCPPVTGVGRSDSDANSSSCRDLNTLGTYMDYVTDLDPEKVFLMGRWTLYQHGLHRRGKLQIGTHFLHDLETEKAAATESAQVLKRALQRTVEHFQDTASVYVLSQPADFYFLGAIGWLVTPEVPRDDLAHWHNSETQLLQHLKSVTTADILDTKTLFCDSEMCALHKEGKPLYKDDNHLSPVGARKQWGMITTSLLD